MDLARVEIVPEPRNDGMTRVKLTSRTGVVHQAMGKLRNEVVLHADGGLYLRLVLEPTRTDLTLRPAVPPAA